MTRALNVLAGVAWLLLWESLVVLVWLDAVVNQP